MGDATQAARLPPGLETLVTADLPVRPEAALAAFDALPPVAVEELLGAWEGDAVPTGHPGEAALRDLGWIGKTFRSAEDVDPIVVRSPADGGREASPVMGGARLRRVEFRGVVSAAMLYDRHPIIDGFRRLGDDAVLGVMDRKGEPEPLVFWLRRVGDA